MRLFPILMLTCLWAGPLALPAQSPESLAAVVHRFAGPWVEEGYALGLQAGTLPPGARPAVEIEIDPALLHAGEVSLVLAEYCQPGMAQYLRFRWAEDRLVYAGATLDGCAIDLPRIDYMELRWEIGEGDTLLVFEAQETEYANFVQARLRRYPEAAPLAPGWACGLQGPLLDLLIQGAYTVYDPAGNPLSLDAALGLPAAVEELTRFDAHSQLLPMLEEICVRTSFDLVVLGSLRPGGVVHLLGIDWAPDAIYLYETQPAAGEAGDLLPLVRGPLFLMIVPEGQRLPVENF